MRKTLNRLIAVCMAVLLALTLGSFQPAAAQTAERRTLSDLVTAERVPGRAATQQCHSNVIITSLANNLLVSAELGYSGGDYAMLRARASAVGPWELYTVCFGSTYDTITSQANGLLVAAELGYGGGDYAMLRARASAIGPWEQFWIASCGSGCVTITSLANGLLVSAELGYGGGDYAMLRARAGALGPWERFA
ncbi:fascin domain-containing protein [Nonomuraea typhae]|uniref:fascin domain-containing protein n=1 Tax=Nonomuraea typhae TaxID=2603600 RepID=UPI0012F8CE44|nr:hypothetical protein [Nonomuraea typhae]